MNVCIMPGGNAGKAGIEVPVRGELSPAIEDLRAQIAACLMEIDEITLQVNPRIEADYALKIGCWENALLESQLAARRAKRRLAMAQAAANQGSAVSEDEIEQQLDREFADWERQVRAAMDDHLKKMEERAASRPMAPAEAREFKALHRGIIKRLHPDLHPELGLEGRRYFEIAQAAFKAGDLDLLRSVDTVTMHLEPEPQPEAPMPEDEQVAVTELLAAQLRLVQERLEALKNARPYALLDQLADPDWIERTVDGLKAQIARQDEACKAYDLRYRALRGE